MASNFGRSQLEARAGNKEIARKIFKYLMVNGPLYGNIFQESALFEERFEEYDRAINILNKGLDANSRYGPLWLTLIRVLEKVAKGNLTKTRETIDKAIKSTPKELQWKIHFEAAQIEDRAGNLALARENYVKSVQHCPSNLVWKIWLAGSRTELRHSLESLSIARRLIQRSLREAPSKKKAQVFLEWARIEEYTFHVDQARTVLQQARKDYKSEWKVFLETILLEMRAGNVEGAVQATEEALKIHSGTGRLWALLIQLKQQDGEIAQMKIFKRALQEVPKSGEVWCEGAKIHMTKRNWSEARRFLDFAIHFTPQYGDSFIEYLRLASLQRHVTIDYQKLELMCVNAEPNYGTNWVYCKTDSLFSTQEVLKEAIQLLQRDGETILSLDCMKQYDLSNVDWEVKWRILFGSDHPKP